MTRRKDRITALFLLISFVEGVAVIATLLSIPSDPKNAFYFGYSKSRLIMLGGVLAALLFLAVLLIDRRLRTRITGRLTPAAPLEKTLPWVGGLTMLFLWLTIWIPAYRLEEWASSFTRLQPLLIWVELMVVQGVFAFWVNREPGKLQSGLRNIQVSRKYLLTGGILTGLTILVFIILVQTEGNFSAKQLYFPPGAPLSGLQVILAWAAFMLLFRLEQRTLSRTPTRKWSTALFFLLLWVVTFIIWSSIPLPCTDDRPGPYPPNGICYPDINDAVYSIGSHYITLGEGVYNHWLTDKPLYMAFLALGQAIFGPSIDDYLKLQIAVIACLPALLFLVGRKKIGFAFGIFLALLAILQGAYAIALYRENGSVNVKLENPELLAGVLLLLFAVAAFKWLTSPTDPRWAILSGGLLGLSVLIRFNPIFIIPFLILVVFLAGKGMFKKVFTTVLFAGLAFLLVFSPWFFSATNNQGKSHYISKIEEVINSRFSLRHGDNKAETDSEVSPPSTAFLPNAQAETGSNEPHEILHYEIGEIDQAGVSGILFHFLNNVYTGLAKLPTSLVLHSIQEQVKDGIWAFTEAQPIWKTRLRSENLIVMGINLTLVLIGIMAAWKRFGWAGLSGVVIQMGYYTGNAVSQTSGGRYLEPVVWVLLLYYCLGLFTLSSCGIKVFSGSADESSQKPNVAEQTSAGLPGRRRGLAIPSLLATFLVLGLILPVLNLIPGQLPEEDDPTVEGKAYATLSQRGLVSADEWNAFLQDPNHILVQGRAYHPRYYRGNFFRPGHLSFELMLLAKDHVLVGYSTGIIPREAFADGSDVIFVGCLIQRDTLWAAQREIVESIAIIQLDHEASLLFDEKTGWRCNR